MGNRKIPMRMCIGCREMKPKLELVRVVKTANGEVLLDTNGKTSGRGAYICKNTECLKKAHKTNAFARAFETSVSDDVYEQLLGAIEKIE